MKQIYIVLTYSGTALSTLIKKFTGDEFAHVSIALDENLEQMYSFGRLNPYNPFIAGFVHEGINFGTFKRFSETDACIYSMEITDIQYEKMKNHIVRMNKFYSSYKFNILGLFGAGFNIKIRMAHSFYCAEFVKYLMDTAKIEHNLPDIPKLEHFKDLGLKLEYKGKLRNYEILENANNVA